MALGHLKREVEALGWAMDVQELDTRQFVGVCRKQTNGTLHRVTTGGESRAEVVRELNRLVRWHEAAKFLRPYECITTVNVGVPATA